MIRAAVAFLGTIFAVLVLLVALTLVAEEVGEARPLALPRDPVTRAEWRVRLLDADVDDLTRATLAKPGDLDLAARWARVIEEREFAIETLARLREAPR